MKKIIFIFSLFCSVYGFSQVDLVQWDGTTTLTPTIQNSYVTADNITGNGLSGPTASWDGVTGTGWPAANAIDTSKYFQITIAQSLNGQFALNSINMGYKGNCKAYEVRYSKAADFSNPVTIITNTAANFYGADIDAYITGLNIIVNGGEKLYIRFYAYNGGGSWRLRNFLSLKGTINASPSPLHGTYTIGSEAGSSFPTITSAVNALNLIGVNAATTFLLDNPLYNRSTYELFPLVIKPYPGNSLYPVTFKPNTGKNVTIEATNFPAETNVPAVFKLNGVDNVTIDGSNNNSTSKNLVIYNNNPLNQEKAVIWIASENNSNGASNNTIKNAVLKQNTRDLEVSFGVFSAGTGSGTTLGKNTSADAANANNTVKNTTFTKVGQAVFVNGSNGNPSSGWKIQSNTIGGTTDTDKPFLGIYLNNATDYEVSGNVISGVLKNATNLSPTLHSGIIINGSSSGSIFNNVVRDVYDSTYNDYCSGIYINSSNNLLYNNMISNVRTNSGDDGNYNLHLKGHGIFINSGNNNKLYYNTVFMNGWGNGNKRSACLYIANGTAIDIRNNIFYNEQSQGTQYAIYSNVAVSQLTSDYNDLVAQNVGYSNGNNRQTLAQWKTDTGKDSHSVSAAPYFLSGTDLHIDHENLANLDNLNDKGTAILNFFSDIDGDARSLSAPDMGADEFTEDIITTWNGTSWSHGSPVATADVIISGAYNTASQPSFAAKNLTIAPGGSIVVKSGTNLRVAERLVNNSTPSAFIVESGANLIQEGQVNDNSGSIQIKRDVTMRRLDYVYWASPVAGQNLKLFSPQTVSPPVGSSRFYEHIETTNQFSVLDPLLNNFVPAKGYMIRAPNNFPANGNLTTFNGLFTGIPNNGDYSIPVTNTISGINLLGNPYASTISAGAFLDENPTITTLYFWTHAQAGDTSNSANYATYNATGETAASMTAPGAAPNGTIQVGQGFMISTTANATIKFRNSMREENIMNQFYRNADPSEKSRVWLNLSNGNGAANQILIGYIPNATNDADSHFDAKLLEANGSKLYTTIEENEYVIQGRALPFTVSDNVALGFKTDVPGNFSITFDHADGLFQQGQDIFLKDNLTGTIHDIKESAYAFSSVAGTFNSRFEIVYQNTLGTKDPVIDSSAIIAYRENSSLVINSGKLLMKDVAVYDIRGRLLTESKGINAASASIPASVARQVLILKITLDNNSTFTKKVIY